MKQLDWLASFVRGLFRKKPVKVQRRPKDNRSKDIESTGRHYYLRGLLDDLEVYFDALKKLKKIDREGYDYFSRVGGQIISRKADLNLTADDMLIESPPSMFMAVFPYDVWTDTDFRIRMVYARKMARPYRAQPFEGVVYHVVAVYQSNNRKHLVPVELYAGLSDGGCVTLKHRQVVRQPLPKGGSVSRVVWDYPKALKDVAEEHDKDIDFYARLFLKSMMSISASASADLRVRCRHGTDVAAFNIDMLRTPYFFADRDVQVNENGQRKKIFHIVRAHKRQNRDGSTTYVKSHFRGMRRFVWNGYFVEIGLHGKHGINPLEFDMEAHDIDFAPIGEEMVDSSAAAQMISEVSV